MEMALQMSNNYVEVCDDEMMYVEGGGTIYVTLSKAFLIDCRTALGCARGSLVGFIAGAVIGAGVGASVGTIIGGALGWIVGGMIARDTIKSSKTYEVYVPGCNGHVYVS